MTVAKLLKTKYLLSEVECFSGDSGKPYDPHKITAKAVRDGLIKKFPCFCGSTKVHAHHQDYAQPLKIVWLCARHHKRLHEALREEGKDVPNRHLVTRWNSKYKTQSEVNDERRANLVKAKAFAHRTDCGCRPCVSKRRSK